MIEKLVLLYQRIDGALSFLQRVHLHMPGDDCPGSSQVLSNESEKTKSFGTSFKTVELPVPFIQLRKKFVINLFQ